VINSFPTNIKKANEKVQRFATVQRHNKATKGNSLKHVKSSLSAGSHSATHNHRRRCQHDETVNCAYCSCVLQKSTEIPETASWSLVSTLYDSVQLTLHKTYSYNTFTGLIIFLLACSGSNISWEAGDRPLSCQTDALNPGPEPVFRLQIWSSVWGWSDQGLDSTKTVKALGECRNTLNTARMSGPLHWDIAAGLGHLADRPHTWTGKAHE